MKRNTFSLLFFLLTIFFSPCSKILAQNIPGIESLGNLQVDELSDDQIRQFMDKVERSGYSQQQLESLAQAKGMSSVEISKLRSRVLEIQSGKGNISSDVNVPRSRINEKTKEDVFTGLVEVNEIEPTNSSEIFGLSFFRNKYLDFEPSLNIPTPKNYLLGSGDEIVIDIWGASEMTYQLQISPEGSITIPKLGPIYLQGLTMERAEARLVYRLKSIYSTLGDNTFAQINLGRIRTISVNIIGEISRPGTYQLSAFATAFNALYIAGGPTEKGTLREISVFRGGKEVATLDAYQFLVFGAGNSIMLQDQDVLLIKPYLNRVSIEGNVHREALFELKKGEKLSDLLTFSGGFTARAYTKSLSIRRNLDDLKTVLTVEKFDFKSTPLRNGDEVTVGEILDRYENRVTLEGAVNHPGEYELTENMTMSQLIRKAGGFTPDVFVNRAVLIRQKKDFSMTTIAFSPQEVIQGSWDMQLQSEDVIKIQSNFDLREELTVEIMGEVQQPQIVKYTDSMTVEDLIFLSNGFRESAAKSFVEVARRIVDFPTNENIRSELFNFPISKDLTLDSEDAKFLLQPFDLVVIRESPYYEIQKIVTIVGEVKFPGKYVISSKSEHISDIVKRAGGFTDDAFADGGTLIRQTEYFDESLASQVKMQRLQRLGSIDTTSRRETFNIDQFENIAISFDEAISNPKSNNDLIVKSGDVITIPKALETVRVRGEVYLGSNVVFNKDLNLKGYTNLAGGISKRALLGKSYVIYPNGRSDRTRSFLGIRNYPKIVPGSEIIIPRKAENKRNINAQAIIAFSSGLATTTLVILQILNLTGN